MYPPANALAFDAKSASFIDYEKRAQLRDKSMEADPSTRAPIFPPTRNPLRDRYASVPAAALFFAEGRRGEFP